MEQEVKDLLEKLKRAEGSKVLPTVYLGNITAEQACLRAASLISSLWSEIEELHSK